jgi:predicted transcriptional regulator YdeE
MLFIIITWVRKSGGDSMEIEHRIVSCDQLNLLELGQMLPWENSIKMQFKMWNRYYSDGTIRRLMDLCKTDKVYGLFCYKCDMDTQTFSYHIVCERPSEIRNTEFEEFTLYPSQYGIFKTHGNSIANKHIIYNELCDAIWKEWLSKSGYISLIEPETKGCEEGYASLEIYNSINPQITPYEIEIWLPISKARL